MAYINEENNKEIVPVTDSSRSSSNKSITIQNHICYLHNNPEIVCVSCLKKLVLEKKLNINIINGSISDFKHRLNVILDKSVHFEETFVDPIEDRNCVEEIQVLRSQAIQISKKNKLKKISELKNNIKETRENNKQIQSQIDLLIKETSSHSSSISELNKNQEYNSNEQFKEKTLFFYKKSLSQYKQSTIKELTSLLDLQKNKTNNYYYICNKRLPLPKYLSKALRINDNSKTYNKQLFLLIEHLSKFLELSFMIFFSKTEFDLSKMTLTMVFAEDNDGIDSSENRIFLIIVKKITFIIFILIKIDIWKKTMNKNKSKETTIDVNEQDYLGKLINRSLLDFKIEEEHSMLSNFLHVDNGIKIDNSSNDADIINTVKKELLKLLI
ncbi:hypothetical protein ACO0SA_003832 [Hanseniaspora valbyensis]